MFSLSSAVLFKGNPFALNVFKTSVAACTCVFVTLSAPACTRAFAVSMADFKAARLYLALAASLQIACASFSAVRKSVKTASSPFTCTVNDFCCEKPAEETVAVKFAVTSPELGHIRDAFVPSIRKTFDGLQLHVMEIPVCPPTSSPLDGSTLSAVTTAGIAVSNAFIVPATSNFGDLLLL